MTGYIAGFSGLLSTGQGGTLEIAGKIPGAKHYASLSGTSDWKRVANEIIELHQLGKLPRPLCLFGHSNGAMSVLKIGRVLFRLRIVIDVLAVIDLTLLKSPPVYGNVKHFLEFHSAYQKTKFDKSFRGINDYYPLDKLMGKNIGHSEAARLDFTQNKIVSTITGLQKGGAKVEKNLFYIGKGVKLSDRDFSRIASEYQVPEYLLRAVVEIEAAGKGSHSSGALVARYEPHVAWRYGKQFREVLAPKGLAYEDWKIGYPKGSPYPLIDECAKLANEELAALSTSWGLGQVMGFNYAVCGFNSALNMVKYFAASEANQIRGMLRFIQGNKIFDALLREDWHTFAEVYNGEEQEKHNYEGRLASAAARWKEKLGDRIPKTHEPDQQPDDEPPAYLDDARASLKKHFPNLNDQNTELVLALALIMGNPPNRPPDYIKSITPENPPIEAGFSLPQPTETKEGSKTMDTQGFVKSKAFWKSKRFWGLAAILAGSIFPSTKPIADLITPTVSGATPEVLTELQAQSTDFIEWVKEGVRYAGIAWAAFGSWKAEHKLTLK